MQAMESSLVRGLYLHSTVAMSSAGKGREPGPHASMRWDVGAKLGIPLGVE